MSASPETAAERIYVAFDYPNLGLAQPQAVLKGLEGTGAGAKLGLEITAKRGWDEPIGEAHEYGFKVFADAKLHDIGNTEWSAARIILENEPDFLNVHATSSRAALSGLVEVRDSMKEDFSSWRQPKLLGVTVLTDVENDEAVEDYRRGRKKQVVHLADKLLDCGLDGVVCSPDELKTLAKYARFDDMVKMVPAIRPKWSVPGDQKNFTTPREAIERGATHIVVGRPITAQFSKIGETPMDAFEAVLQEVEGAV